MLIRIFQGFVDEGFIDSYWVFNEKSHNYSWWSYRAGARGRNKGWRIDYHMVTENLKDKLVGAAIHPEAMQSDHCPVRVDIDF